MFAIKAFGQTQDDLNKYAAYDFAAADKDLNDVYKQILTEYANDTLFIKNLKLSERLWIQFRDAEVAMKYPNYKDGYRTDAQPMCIAVYKESLTRDRIKTLRQWLDGIEEGDVCKGSVKTKGAQ